MAPSIRTFLALVGATILCPGLPGQVALVEGAFHARRPSLFVGPKADDRRQLRAPAARASAAEEPLALPDAAFVAGFTRRVLLGALPFVAYAGLFGTSAVAARALSRRISPRASYALLGACVAAPALGVALQLVGPSGGRVARSMGGVPADAWLVNLANDAAKAVGVAPPKAVYTIPSPEPNAFATGLWGATAVAVTKGLVEALSERELKAVLAHEMGHLKHRDVGRNVHVAIAAAGLGGLWQCGRQILRSARLEAMRAPPPPRGGKGRGSDTSADALTGVGLALCATGIGAQAVAHALRLGASRAAELEADREAADAYGSDALASALTKISRRAREHDDLRTSSMGMSMAHMMISNGAAPRARPAPRGKHKPSPLSKLAAQCRQLASTHPTLEVRLQALREINKPGHANMVL